MSVKIGELEFFSVTELAEAFDTTELTIRSYIGKGGLKARKIGQRYFVSTKALAEYFDQQEDGILKTGPVKKTKEEGLTLASFDASDAPAQYVYESNGYGFRIWNEDGVISVSKFFGYDNDGELLEEKIAENCSNLESAIWFINKEGAKFEKNTKKRMKTNTGI